MPDAGFGSGLWRNAQAVRFGPHHELLAPVRADGSDGIVVGVDAGAASDAAVHPDESGQRRGLRGLVDRWRRP
jgi:hypothetical protein